MVFRWIYDGHFLDRKCCRFVVHGIGWIQLGYFACLDVRTGMNVAAFFFLAGFGASIYLICLYTLVIWPTQISLPRLNRFFVFSVFTLLLLQNARNSTFTGDHRIFLFFSSKFLCINMYIIIRSTDTYDAKHRGERDNMYLSFLLYFFFVFYKINSDFNFFKLIFL